MDTETHTPHEHEAPQPAPMPAPVVTSPPSSVRKMPFNFSLQGTSNAFVAEYSIMLIALTFTLSDLVWLVYAFFGLVVTTMDSSGFDTMFGSVPMVVLWLAVFSLVSIPVVAVLWSRTQGELANNPEYKGELPKGGARGFRSFWLVVSGLSVLFMTAGAIYAPLNAALLGGKVVEALVGGTLPALVGAAVVVCGIMMVTRPVYKRAMVRMMIWVVVIATALLVGVDYVWASNTHATEKTTPYSSPYTPYTTPDPLVPSPTDCPYCGSYPAR